MNVLVAYASKHGSTREIAEAIGAELGVRGLTADVRDVSAVGDVGPYDAVVLGSSVYRSRWRPEARRFVASREADLRRRPLWLFSSGVVGPNDPMPGLERRMIDRLVARTGAREHRLLRGRLDGRVLSFADRVSLRTGDRLAGLFGAERSREGDLRDWEAIRGWAREIAGALSVRHSPSPVHRPDTAAAHLEHGRNP